MYKRQGDDTGGGGGGDTGGGSGDDTGGGGGGGGSTAIQETETATFESISVVTTDGSLTALGTITESDDETVVTVSGESFAKLADHAETNSTGIVFNAGLGSVTFNSKAPVSYTHLDVYKRQPQRLQTAKTQKSIIETR